MTLAGAVKVNGTAYPTLADLTVPPASGARVRIRCVTAMTVQATLTWNGKAWIKT